MNIIKDVIIVGGGPAGISAAIYLKKDNMDVAVFTTDNSVLKKARVINNYYGIKEINGEELYNIGIEQAIDLNIEVLKEEVTRIEKNNLFEVTTNKGSYFSKSVILATGITRFNPQIKGLDEFEGKGVSYCATCDGFFFRNKKLALIGNGNYAVEEIKHLMNVTKDVVVLTNGEQSSEMINNLNLKVIDDKVIRVAGNDTVEKVVFESYEINVDGVFVAVGVAGSSNFGRTLGLEMNKMFIKVDSKFETNMHGLFAIGDAIGGVLQIGKAVSDGILVSKEVLSYIKKNNN